MATRTPIVGGNWKMHLDRGGARELLRELREQLSRPAERQTLETRRMAARLRPYAEEFYRSWADESGGPPTGAPHYVYNSRT